MFVRRAGTDITWSVIPWHVLILRQHIYIVDFSTLTYRLVTAFSDFTSVDFTYHSPVIITFLCL